MGDVRVVPQTNKHTTHGSVGCTAVRAVHVPSDRKRGLHYNFATWRYGVAYPECDFCGAVGQFRTTSSSADMDLELDVELDAEKSVPNPTAGDNDVDEDEYHRPAAAKRLFIDDEADEDSEDPDEDDDEYDDDAADNNEDSDEEDNGEADNENHGINDDAAGQDGDATGDGNGDNIIHSDSFKEGDMNHEIAS